jgi:hypothetical protein
MMFDAANVEHIRANGAFLAENWSCEPHKTPNMTIGQPRGRRYVPRSRENAIKGPLAYPLSDFKPQLFFLSFALHVRVHRQNDCFPRCSGLGYLLHSKAVHRQRLGCKDSRGTESIIWAMAFIRWFGTYISRLLFNLSSLAYRTRICTASKSMSFQPSCRMFRRFVGGRMVPSSNVSSTFLISRMPL